ncbi:MAG: mycofactocin system FadH/OYE family oxidoreductase 1 [Acidimicrobiales bacterium]
MTELGDVLRLGPATARNRLVFGPHETNLGRGRSISGRHVAYYRARAAGGVGVVVVEEASVHASDWPYERAPFAGEAVEGWHDVAAACHEEGSLVIAAIGHCGGQGSTAYHQRALWGPWRTPDVATREVPKIMEQDEIDAVVAAFATAARLAMQAGCDGVEINAGQWSLLRQFASGLTNQRRDAYGDDPALLLAQVLEASREAAPGTVIGLRASCDELAPWAGIVPDAAVGMLARLAAGPSRPDYVTVVRGSAYGTSGTRPDGHVAPGFNRALGGLVRAGLPGSVSVVAQGSLVDVDLARSIVASGDADAVEMTRAQIADPLLSRKLLAGAKARIRPCVLCNQLCQVRDVRNPLVSCIGEPRSGHEIDDVDPEEPPRPTRRGGQGSRRVVLVVGGGPAGLECARVASLGGRRVTLRERDKALGGMVSAAAARAPGRQRLSMLASWLESECRMAGVDLIVDHEVTVEELDSHDGPIALCTGSRPGRRSYEAATPGSVVTAADVLAAERLPGERVSERVVVWDPVGGPIGVGVAELLAGVGGDVVLVTPDFVAGEQLSRTGDLAPANVRLAQAGVEVARHAIVRVVDLNGVTIEDRFSGERRLVGGAILVDAGHRLPEDSLYRSLLAGRERDRGPKGAGEHPVLLAGDALAPRTIHEAVLEGRRVGLALSQADSC